MKEKRKRSAASPATRTLSGSVEAKRMAAGILEVFAGLRGPQEACAGLGVSLPRYYHLESRALGGLIAALEPRPKGRRRKPEDQIAGLVREKEQLTRELQRAQALVRAANRAMGIPSVGNGSRVGGKSRRRRTRRATVRAERTIEALRQPAEAAPEPGAATEG
jgi:hypothetical protein